MAAPVVWLHLHWVSLKILLRHARENWHKVQESDSFVPAPAFHANFSHKNPSTPPPPGRLLTALSSVTITLPEGVDKANLNAEYRNGILEITAPISAAALPRKVEIKAPSGADARRATT